MGVPPTSERLRRLIFPSYGARSNAAQAVDEIARLGDAVVLHGADVALLAGHPVGLSYRKAAGRLGTALWEVFPGHVALLDRDGVVVSVNRAWRDFGLAHGANATAGLGCNYLDVCVRAADNGAPEAMHAASIVRAALNGHTAGELAYAAGGGDEQRWFNLQAVPIPGQHSGALIVHTDITADRRREQEWQHRAMHDSLTGLPNRALLTNRLEHAVAGADRDPRSLAVLFIDLDGFKTVNDRHGHPAGDLVLRHAAEHLAAGVRTSDTIGRWGGDEFLVIAERLDDSATADDLAARLAAGVQEPIDIGGERLTVHASIGVAHLDPHQNAEQLVQAADRALQQARSSRPSQAVGIAT
jgi:diguanylate cyclase (GGDEF)-like protein